MWTGWPAMSMQRRVFLFWCAADAFRSYLAWKYGHLRVISCGLFRPSANIVSVRNSGLRTSSLLQLVFILGVLYLKQECFVWRLRPSVRPWPNINRLNRLTVFMNCSSGSLYRKLSRKHEFHVNQYSEEQALPWDVFPCSLHFLSDLDNIRCKACSQKFIKWGFCENGRNLNHRLLIYLLPSICVVLFVVNLPWKICM
jgi:uncharacterized membrane protein